jgi:hypothetical protein
MVRALPQRVSDMLDFRCPLPVPGVLAAVLLCLGTSGCTPTVKVATDEPITINLNVNIKHEILVKVDQDLDDLFADNSELF